MAHLSETELVDELRALAGKLHRHPYTHDMREYGAYSPQTYTNQFGSWHDALTAAGLTDLTAPVLDDEEVLAALQAVADESSVDAPPTHQQVRDHGRYSPWLYIDRFDAWITALSAAGFEMQPRIDPDACPATDTELLTHLQDIAATINRTPTASEMDAYADYQSAIYEARFGSWEDTVSAADLAPLAASRHTVYTDTELLNHLRDLAADLERSPTVDVMNERDGPSALTYQYRFGSWQDALREAGIEPRKTNRTEISDEELLDALQSLAADLDATPTCHQMNEQGAYSPTTYERRFGSWTNAVRAAGLPPNTVRSE
jgi:hypothetical protein